MLEILILSPALDEQAELVAAASNCRGAEGVCFASDTRRVRLQADRSSTLKGRTMNRITLTRLSLWRVCAVAAFGLALAMPAAAQSVTTADIQRLQDQVYDASGDVYRMRSTSSDSAARLQTDLDDLRDEVVYLKVKLRKEGSVTRPEYNDLQTRIQDVRSRARGDMRTNDTSAGSSSTGGWRTNSDPNASATTGTRGGYGNGSGSSTGVSGGVVDDRTRTDQGSTSRSSGTSAI